MPHAVLTVTFRRHEVHSMAVEGFSISDPDGLLQKRIMNALKHADTNHSINGHSGYVTANVDVATPLNWIKSSEWSLHQMSIATECGVRNANGFHAYIFKKT